MKHLVIDYHFVRYLVELSKLLVVYVFVGDPACGCTYQISISVLPLLPMKQDICVIYNTPS